MTHRPLAVDVLDSTLTIVRLPADAPFPAWIDEGKWYTVTRTMDECSVVCESRLVPDDVQQAGPWKALKVEGPLEFDMTGVLCRIANPLAEAEISVFAISTYDTDYVLVRTEDLDRAVDRLGRAGIIVRVPH